MVLLRKVDDFIGTWSVYKVPLSGLRGLVVNKLNVHPSSEDNFLQNVH